jgi:hypothetical protein
VGEVLGGWQVSWILDYESGTPFGVGENNSPWPNGFNRPNRISSVHLKTYSYDREREYFLGKIPQSQAVLFNPAAFQATSTYVLGNASRLYSSLREPAYRNEDFTLAKHFTFKEGISFILSMDYFNAFNRTQFYGPDQNGYGGNNANNTGVFGTAASRGQNNINRQGQVSGRIQF